MGSDRRKANALEDTTKMTSIDLPVSIFGPLFRKQAVWARLLV